MSIPTAHTLTFTVKDARDWQHAEDVAADVVRQYFRIAPRGRNSEPQDEVLSGATVAVTPDEDGTFRAVFAVTR